MAITGTIALKSGTLIEITDSLLVNNGLSVSMSTCSSSFDVGSFNAAKMQISIYDSEALEHEFDGATISLAESVNQTVTFLGTYYVDGTETKRQRSVVKLTAYDASAAFDTELPATVSTTSYTPLTALQAACTAAGITLATTVITGFPNNAVSFTPSSVQIQSWRDLVMWTAQLLCANAVINRSGALEIRRARYLASGAAITVDKIITGDQRTNIQFSDVRTYIKYIAAYSGGKNKNYTSTYTPTDAQARAASFSLPANPLLDGKSEADCDTINSAWLTYIDGFMQREIKATLFSDANISLGDTCRFSGGRVDVRGSIVGVVTAIKWKYHGNTVIECRAPQAVSKEA